MGWGGVGWTVPQAGGQAGRRGVISFDLWKCVSFFSMGMGMRIEVFLKESKVKSLV